ncbi:hypothetical protein [Ostreibacterium oceani]|uniref:Uncharacterized protein n=1 Tax=Ostreibacterium oceani TaxID=2654998 RepID=A0A6N7EXC4_9GAMM|nr:hypothetical protein [Ostreibacterium oceani]MPV86593.1 hypothetical protein [Ostreibacterium oceani]
MNTTINTITSAINGTVNGAIKQKFSQLRALRRVLPSRLSLALVTVLALFGQVAQAQITPGSPDNFIMVWNTGSTTTINVPTLPIGGYNYSLYWEEVGNPSNNNTQLGITDSFHIISGLSANTDYRIEIVGDVPQIVVSNSGGADTQLREVSQWGSIA